jgi:hypothetical protein
VRALRNWRELLRHEGRLLIIDGIWGDDDHAADDGEKEEDDHPGGDFYTEEVLASLPATRFKSVDDVVRMLEAGGFGAVRMLDLSGVDEAEGHLDTTRGRYGLVAGR